MDSAVISYVIYLFIEFKFRLVCIEQPAQNSQPVHTVQKLVWFFCDIRMDFDEPVCHSLSPVLEILYYFCLIPGTTKPVNWPKPVYMLDPAEPDNNGFINEDFIVWMRTAALPTFRKLYRLIERKNNLQPTLQAGRYSLDIAYSIL